MKIALFIMAVCTMLCMYGMVPHRPNHGTHDHCGVLMRQLIALSDNQATLQQELDTIASKHDARAYLSTLLKMGSNETAHVPHEWHSSPDHLLCRRVLYFIMWKSDHSLACLHVLKQSFADVHGLNSAYYCDTRNWLLICAVYQQKSDVVRYLEEQQLIVPSML